MPGYDAAQRVARDAPAAVTGAITGVVWVDSGRAFEYDRDGKRYRYDVASGRDLGCRRLDRRRFRPRRSRPRLEQAAPDRGRQFDSTLSPDGTLKAFYKDRNVWISSADDRDARAITTDGSVAGRIKYGTASWVYGEELSQRTAMWWSPDSRKLAYYRFDESEVPDYYVTLNQTQLQTTLDIEAFPNAGTPNPVVDLFVYDVATEAVDAGRRPRRQAVRQRRGRPLRLSRRVVRRRPRAAVPPHQPPAEHHGARRRQPGDRRVPRRAARGVADRLARRRAADAVPRRRPALHLGIAAQRLEQLLSLRSQRHS